MNATTAQRRWSAPALLALALGLAGCAPDPMPRAAAAARAQPAPAAAPSRPVDHGLVLVALRRHRPPPARHRLPAHC
ncbi:MAG: hypothetical protein U5L03_14260 [Burkholderiaceae bacterium]|nr:hypothetical protein [Burkholderiaceae bacterium]